MAKYINYIKLSPHYESMVYIDSDSLNLDMWKDYIVHEDMKTAIEAVCDSLKYEDPDKRQVEEKLFEMCLDYRSVVSLNEVLCMNGKNLKALANDMANFFDNMKVPMMVIKKFGYEWLLTLNVMKRNITAPWSKSTLSNREHSSQLLIDTAHYVWELITAPKPILQQYLVKNKIVCPAKKFLRYKICCDLCTTISPLPNSICRLKSTWARLLAIATRIGFRRCSSIRAASSPLNSDEIISSSRFNGLSPRKSFGTSAL